MSVLVLTAFLAVASIAAGFVGALTGLGGGVVIVPLLVLAFHVDIHYAIGVSLVSVIATSSGAASAFVREGFSNLRVGMLLEIATTLGALSGAAIAPFVHPSALEIVFGVALLWSAYAPRRNVAAVVPEIPVDRIAEFLRLNSSYPSASGPRPYRVHRVRAGFGLMYGAGILSGLLGIGSGAVKVLAMDRAMGLPFKVSTTTSNFMIGVTAAASAGVYFHRGYIDPGLACPVVVGGLLGSMAGARVLATTTTGRLRQVFVAVIVVLALEMMYDGATGSLPL